jgi:hypothetical protein
LKRKKVKNNGVIREKVAPFITSDNLNFLISDGYSMYTGSKGINDTAKNDLLDIIKKWINSLQSQNKISVY